MYPKSQIQQCPGWGVHPDLLTPELLNTRFTLRCSWLKLPSGIFKESSLYLVICSESSLPPKCSGTGQMQGLSPSYSKSESQCPFVKHTGPKSKPCFVEFKASQRLPVLLFPTCHMAGVHLISGSLGRGTGFQVM